jgi:hypothetical protein
MSLQSIELSIAECDELLASLSGPNPSLGEWRAVVQRAFAKGVAAATPKDTIPSVLVEPLIDIAETVARAELALPTDSRDRYGIYAQWAGEFQRDFSRRLAAGEEPAFSYVEDIESFAKKKALESGFISIAPTPATAQEALTRSVFREYALTGSRDGELEVDENAKVHLCQDNPAEPVQGAYVQCFKYISNDEIVGFLNALMKEAKIEAEALDEAVHSAAEEAVPTQAREEDLDLISMDASDVNNDGVDTQIQFLVARLGPDGAFQAVEAAIAEAPRQADAPRG